jgi:transcriptional regulator with XRE-family HTH domain
MPPRITPRKPVVVYLAAWRRFYGLSQCQLGERFLPWIDKSSISRYERDVRGLTLDALAAYAEALGVPIVRLFEPPPRRQRGFSQVTRAAHLTR